MSAAARRSQKSRRSAPKSEVHLSVATPWPDDKVELVRRPAPWPRVRRPSALVRPPGHVPLVQGDITCEPRRRGEVDDARRRYEMDGDRDHFADSIYESSVERSAEAVGGWHDDGLVRRDAPPAAAENRWLGPLACLNGGPEDDDEPRGCGGVQVFVGLGDDESRPGLFSFVGSGA